MVFTHTLVNICFDTYLFTQLREQIKRISLIIYLVNSIKN